MAHTFKELKAMTVAQLRELASGLEHPAVQGYTQLTKEPLIKALCEALGVETHEHHEVKGLDKGKVKKRIKELKKDRDGALEAKDYKQLKKVRTEIKKLKRQLRRATV